MKRNSLIILFLLFTTVIFAQNENKESQERQARNDLREGNKLYNQLKFSEAEVAYKKALSKNPEYGKAAYNLGNSAYLQGRTKEATASYELSAGLEKDKKSKAQIFHNMGNSLMKEKNYAKAVEAYKNSLRSNPNDDETRYNLALAQKMLKDQQNNQNQQNKDNNSKDNKDNKDNKNDKGEPKDDKNKDQQDKDNKDQDKKDDNKDKDDKKDEKEKEQNQPKPNALSPEEMKQLLDAMNNEENKTQKKLNDQKSKGQKIKQEKDW